MNIRKYTLKITLTTPLLGSQPGKDTPASDYMKDKLIAENPDEKEEIVQSMEDLPQNIAKGTTCFYRDEEDKPVMMNYQIKGLIKGAAEVLNGIVLEGQTTPIKNLKSKITNTFYVKPRSFPIHMGNKKIEFLERPLRGMTAQGPRVSLARSEMIPAGAWFECEIEIVEIEKFNLSDKLLKELLDYSQYQGLLQWRNSGAYGTFDYKLTEHK